MVFLVAYKKISGKYSHNLNFLSLHSFFKKYNIDLFQRIKLKKKNYVRNK